MILINATIRCDLAGCSEMVPVQVALDSQGRVDLASLEFNLPGNWAIYNGKFYCHPGHIDYELDD
jgi:hypothetical protein